MLFRGTRRSDRKACALGPSEGIASYIYIYIISSLPKRSNSGPRTSDPN